MEELFPKSPFDETSLNTSEASSKRRRKRKINLPRLAAVDSDDKEKTHAPDAHDLHNTTPHRPLFSLEALRKEQHTQPDRHKAARHAQPDKSLKIAPVARAEVAYADTPRPTVVPVARPETMRPHSSEESTAVARALHDAPPATPDRALRPSAKTYEPLPSPELAPTQLNGGEVVIDLSKPVEERVIPLHAEPTMPAHLAEQQPAPATAAAERTQPAAETVPPVIAHNTEPAASASQSEHRPEVWHRPVAVSVEAAPVPPVAAGSGNKPPVQPPEAPAGAPGEMPEPSDRPTTPVEPLLFPLERPQLLPERPRTLYSNPYEHPATMPVPAAETIPTLPVRNAETSVAARPDEVAEAVQAARKDGTRRGLLTGLLVGGAYEHFKHRRREKRHTKQQLQQAHKLEQERQQYRFAISEYAKRQDRTEHQFRQTEHRLMGQASEAARRFALAEPATAGAGPRHTERLSAGLPGREHFAAVPGNGERSGRSMEHVQPAGDQPEIGPDGRIQVPDGHILNTEGWVITEIDKATGKAVEQPSFTYGHEYYRERAQEGTPTTQRNVAAGEVALVAAAMSQHQADKSAPRAGTGAGGSAASGPVIPGAASSAAHIPNATMQGAPPSHKSQADDATDDTHERATAQPPIWPLLAVLVVIVVLIILLV